MADTRDEVYGFIVQYPGLHAREVERRLGLSEHLAVYHLEALAADGHVQRLEDTGFVRYFPSVGQPRWGAQEVVFVCAMRRPVAMRMIVLLLDEGPTAHGDLARRLGIAKASASYHLKRLVEDGILQVDRVGRRSVYEVADPAWAMGMLANVTPLPDDLDPFQAIWSDLVG